MKSNKAFTLIEILVVVLIIGILAAIAVPKYQYAVLKTRYNNLKPAATSIYRAVQAYELANNTYPTSAAQLDIEFPPNCTLDGSYISCFTENHAMGFAVNMYQDLRYCLAYTANNSPEHRLCKEETNTSVDRDVFYWYPLTIKI